MWPIAMLVLSAISALLWYRTRHTPLDRYRLDVLALISGGAATMFLVDSAYSYLEEGVFIDVSGDALLLSMVLTLFTIALWLLIVLVKRVLRG